MIDIKRERDRQREWLVDGKTDGMVEKKARKIEKLHLYMCELIFNSAASVRVSWSVVQRLFSYNGPSASCRTYLNKDHTIKPSTDQREIPNNM